MLYGTNTIEIYDKKVYINIIAVLLEEILNVWHQLLT